MKRYLIQQGTEFVPTAYADTKAPLTKIQLILRQQSKVLGKALLTRISSRNSGTFILWLPKELDHVFIQIVIDNTALGYKLSQSTIWVMNHPPA